MVGADPSQLTHGGLLFLYSREAGPGRFLSCSLTPHTHTHTRPPRPGPITEQAACPLRAWHVLLHPHICTPVSKMEKHPTKRCFFWYSQVLMPSGLGWLLTTMFSFSVIQFFEAEKVKKSNNMCTITTPSTMHYTPANKILIAIYSNQEQTQKKKKP